MYRQLLICLMAALSLAACKGRQTEGPEVQEDLEAKAMMQGIWIEDVTEEPVFKVEGDTIYYPDDAGQPSYFRIVDNRLELGGLSYTIIKQSPTEFFFENQTGDSIRLLKTQFTEDSLAFDEVPPEVIAVSDVVKRDSVIVYNGQRYHWYIAVNPTKRKVTKMTYNDEGVGVENVFYDNIIHVSLFRGPSKLYSEDFNKQLYSEKVPREFLSQAILSDMIYKRADEKGFHFNATLCIPNEASCYLVETIVGFDGQVSMELLEY